MVKTSYKTSVNHVSKCSSSETQGQIVGQFFWHQSEARTAATVWNWSGKTLSPGALLAILYFSSCHIFFCPFRLFLIPTICPWVSEDAKCLELSKEHAQWKLHVHAALCRSFSRGINKPTTQITVMQARSYAKGHARKKPLLAG